MLSLAFALVLQGPSLTRDPYGVPIIQAATEAQAYELQGYAAAQDRLWQMENSRRLARGRMAEAFGARYLAADREIVRMGYSDDEIATQLDSLSDPAKAAVAAYAKGVNRYIGEARDSGGLPKGYAENGLTPAPWTPIDTAAIFIQLARRFGQGGAGELRNLALVKYLQTQPGAKAQAMDVLDDLAWQNDPRSPTTISPSDDPVRTRPVFPSPSRDITESHLKRLPNVGLLELMPAIKLAERESSTLLAESVAAPFKVGSYAVVVSGKRSSTGWPMLLSAPQMGHTTPSVVHEVSIHSPDLTVAGMDVPGVPGVIIGATPNFACAMTSGVADTDDILFYETKKPGTYRFGNKDLPVLVKPISVAVKGAAAELVQRERTAEGPIILKSAAGAIFASRMAYWGRELAAMDVLIEFPKQKTPDQIEAAMAKNPMSFNVFYATKSDIGYFYTGDVPLRPLNFDPRFPVPASPEVVSLGYVPRTQMPRVRNPKSGLLANWNNKPVAWWPNLDTPVWGRIFRNQVLLDALAKPKLGLADVELAAWTIARRNETFSAFRRYLPGIEGLEGGPRELQPLLGAYDGWDLAGHVGPALYAAWLNGLRHELFASTTGTFLTEANFRTIIQPSVILNALEGKTAANYLGKRSTEEVSRAALARAIATLSKTSANPEDWSFMPGTITVPGQAPIPYGNRGTYIQLIELGPQPRGRSVASPGIAESGAHALDQSSLARAWVFKKMTLGLK